MKVVYKADDGTEFNTEQECTEYESPLNKKLIDVINKMIPDHDLLRAKYIIENIDKLKETIEFYHDLRRKNFKEIDWSKVSEHTPVRTFSKTRKEWINCLFIKPCKGGVQLYNSEYGHITTNYCEIL